MSEKQNSKRLRCPPLFKGRFPDGSVNWERVDITNLDEIGLVLANHLMIEHYMTSVLEATCPKNYDFKTARLRFKQKLDLLGAKPIGVFSEFHLYAAINELNDLRNHMMHRIRASLRPSQVVKMTATLMEIAIAGQVGKDFNALTPVDIVSQFGSVAGSYFAGALTVLTEQKRKA